MKTLREIFAWRVREIMPVTDFDSKFSPFLTVTDVFLQVKLTVDDFLRIFQIFLL